MNDVQATLRLVAELSHHLIEREDPCQDRGVVGLCDVAAALRRFAEATSLTIPLQVLRDGLEAGLDPADVMYEAMRGEPS
jgi:hypothetical protein